MPHKKGHKVTGKLGLRKRLDQMLHGDRKNKQMSKQTTVPDSQKRGMKSTATMSDEQKRASRSNVLNRPESVSDAQKTGRARPADSDVQKKGQIRRKNTTAMSDEQKKTQTKSEPKTFKEAFRRARQEGKAKFTYKGKSYAAVTQDEVNKAFKAGKIKKKTLRAYLNMKKKK